jgi:hypothetical protein
MEMMLVDMGCHNKRVPALGKPHGKLVAQPVGLFGRYLPRFERLPDLVRYYVFVALVAPGQREVLAFGQHELGIGGDGVAFIACDKLAAARFFWIFGVTNPVCQRLRDGFFADMQWD